MEQTKIVAIQIKDRIKEANKTQGVLSKHGKIIHNRIGFHEVSNDVCSREGTLILHIQSSEDALNILMDELAVIGGIEAKSISFD